MSVMSRMDGRAGRCRCRARCTPSGCRSAPCPRASRRGRPVARPPRCQAQEDGRRGVDGHRRRYPIERDALEELRHVLHASDGNADLPTSLRAMRWSRRSPSAWAGRRPRRAPSAPARAGSGKRWLVSAAEPKPAYWRIVQRRPRNIVGCTPACRGIRRESRGRGHSPGRRCAPGEEPRQGRAVEPAKRPGRSGVLSRAGLSVRASHARRASSIVLPSGSGFFSSGVIAECSRACAADWNRAWCAAPRGPG